MTGHVDVAVIGSGAAGLIDPGRVSSTSAIRPDGGPS